MRAPIFELTFHIEGAAFGESADFRQMEVTRILRFVAERTSRGDTDGIVHDVNGNAIGTWLLEHNDA